MPRNYEGVDDPDRWLEFAKDDLKIAQKGKLLDFRREALCFHAQHADLLFKKYIQEVGIVPISVDQNL